MYTSKYINYKLTTMIPLSQPDISTNEIDAAIAVLKSGWLWLWPKLKEFEELWAKIADTKYASAVNSWTSGLHLIVKSLWIWENHSVFVPSFSFIASSNCFIYEWATPIFTDIEEDTYNLDPEWIQNYIDQKCSLTDNQLIDNSTWKIIKAIVWVHIFGHPFDVDGILEICKKYKLFLIEDAAESIWSQYNWKKCWQFWEASIFAFYPNKQLTTWEGWIITTNNKNHFELYESLKNQWRWDSTQWLSHDKLWYNYRLSEINAAIWIEQMKRLEEIIKKRSKVAESYDKLFSKHSEIVKTPTIKDYCTLYSRFVYVIELKTHHDIWVVIEHLKQQGIQSKNYFSPIHSQEFYVKNYNTDNISLPVTERISKKTLSIPFYNTLKDKDIEYVVETIVSFIK